MPRQYIQNYIFPIDKPTKTKQVFHNRKPLLQQLTLKSDNDIKQNSFRPFAHIIDLFRINRGEKSPVLSRSNTMQKQCRNSDGLPVVLNRSLNLLCTRMCDLNSCTVQCDRWREDPPSKPGSQKLTGTTIYSKFKGCLWKLPTSCAQQSGRLMEDSDTLRVWYMQRQVQSCKYSAWGERRGARCCFWQNLQESLHQHPSEEDRRQGCELCFLTSNTWSLFCFQKD